MLAQYASKPKALNILSLFIGSEKASVKIKANLKAVDQNGKTPLQYAIENCQTENYPFTCFVSRLIKADYESILILDKDENTVLHHAVEKGLVKATTILLKTQKAAELMHVKNKKNMSALDIARNKYNELKNKPQQNAYEDIINMLEEHLKTHTPKTAPEVIYVEDGADEHKYRIKKNVIDLTTHGKRSSENIMAEYPDNKKQKNEIGSVVSQPPKDTGETIGNHALHYAAAKGDIEQVRRLIKKNSELNLGLNKQDQSGWLPLHYAAALGHLDIVKEILETLDTDLNNDLLDVYSNTQNADGRTALHLAIIGKHWDIAIYLAEKAETEMTIEDKNKKTPLDLARNNVEIYEILYNKALAQYGESLKQRSSNQ